MTRRFRLAALFTLASALLAFAAPAFASPADRLERFRALASARLGTADVVGDPAGDETYREIYTLLDEEIVESLASGSVFASVAFLQDRLDGFGEAWGATVVRIMRAGPLTVGAFQLSDGLVGNSVRVYGRLRDESALLATLSREGRPFLFPLPASGTPAQFLVAWEGQPSTHGTRPLLLEIARHDGDGVRVVWSSSTAFPDGLFVRRWGVRGSEIRVQYEVRYPGWTPGCEGQTEQEDVYRLAPGAATFARVARSNLNAWHRDFRLSVARLFSAITADDRQTLTGLVPDPKVRSQLPRSLRAEPACDAAEGQLPDRVSTAATAERGPWQLMWERRGSVWRLVQAAPVPSRIVQ
ncbi:MAG: hypothetical protein HYU41_24340 [Candidatus Rokubacteria bacterium]|nr:hypothetical protein [Candidatus Rokubacteria bacterium]